MPSIAESARGYETWLHHRLGDRIVTADVVHKREKMRESPFVFLRATYWRWAETILDLCGDARDAPSILAIGDVHLENFGTWRDAEGRLVWGVNDFDDAALMPYPLDLVRLAASALLAPDSPSPAALCTWLWRGYQAGLADPQPVILERDHRWLREAILLPEKARAKWWDKLAASDEPIPPLYRAALAAAMPDPAAPLVAFARRAGTGSLGKPRYAGIADWRGGPVVRECKAILPSVWRMFAPSADARAGATPDDTILAGVIAGGATRAIDPHYHVADGLVVRRLSPNSRKIEADDAGALLVSRAMITAMGREIATCHAGDGARIAAVRADCASRTPEWLETMAREAAAAVHRDFAAFA